MLKAISGSKGAKPKKCNYPANERNSMNNERSRLQQGRRIAARLRAASLITFSLWASPVLSATNDCPQATNDVPLDLEYNTGVGLLYPSGLRVFNLYWSDQWNSVTGQTRLQQADIDRATKALLNSGYFDRLCQYGVPPIRWGGSTDTHHTANPCVRNPGSTISTLDLIDFLSCEEAAHIVTDVPNEGGLPTPITCPLCTGLYNGPAFPPLPSCAVAVLGQLLTGDLTALACFATPNTTGDTIYNVILPKGTTINDFGRMSCIDYGAFHFQIPSDGLIVIDPLINPVPPFTAWAPATAGRPIYFTVIPADCVNTAEELVELMSHEMVEAATDPLPLAHWIDTSEADPNLGILDVAKIPSLLEDGEACDICSYLSPVRLVGDDGSGGVVTNDVAPYWSNGDNAGVVGNRRVVRTTLIATGLPSGLTLEATLHGQTRDLVVALRYNSFTRTYIGEENLLEDTTVEFPEVVDTATGQFIAANPQNQVEFPTPRHPSNPRPDDQIQTIQVDYCTGPTITCPGDIHSGTDATGCYATVDPGFPTFVMPCGGKVGGLRSDGKQLSDPYPLGVTTIRWGATSVGITVACTQTVTVVDTTPPQLDCPTNLVRSTDPGLCSAVVYYLVTAEDYCSPFVTLQSDPPSGSVFSEGTNWVFCVATDAAGNSNACSFAVTVLDREPPVVACTPALNPSGKNSPQSGFFKLSATDNCDPNPKIFIGDSASSFIGGPFASGDVVRVTQAPGVTPNQKAGPPGIAAGLQLNGDAVVYAVDAAGNTATSVLCAVSPPK
jgi:hypothetical protein